MSYLFLAVLIVGISIFMIRALLTLLQGSACTKCEGQGYWKGTRGEKNVCKACGGSGRKGK